MTTRPANPGQTRPTVVQVQTPFGLCTELSLQIFLDNILPPLRYDLNPKTILGALRNGQKFHNLITKHDRWRGFARDPKDSNQSVYHTFRHLEAVVKSILKTTEAVFNSTEHALHFESNSASVARYRYSSDGTFPDASFVEGSELGWEKIAVCGEYEKDEVPHYVEDSIARVTKNMAHCMGHDLRRRFIFGFTIKNTDMRFWLCDRSRFLTSEPFNFITDHLPWIHFCLSILHAKPDQLGWDPGMIPSPDGRNFDIPVRSEDGQTRTYRTQSILSSVGSRNRLGKGTKVWKAVRVEDGEEIGPPVVLKDCWIYPDFMREGNAIQNMRRDAKLASQDDKMIAQMVPDVEWHGDVFIGDDEPVLDSTRMFATDELTQDRTSESSVCQLVHYRLVLTPLMQKSIEHEISIPVIFEALAYAAGCLRLMHQTGWVHRDVSTGNILLGDPPRLVDYEYAKQASDDEDLTLGTRFFKAFEVDAQSYTYMPLPEPKPRPIRTLKELERDARATLARRSEEREIEAESSLRHAQVEEETRQTEAEEELQSVETAALPRPVEAEVPPRPIETEASPPHAETAPPDIQLRYNPLHDMESLWWIAVYFVLQREIQNPTPDPLADEDTASWDREKQRKWANGVFYSNDCRCPIMLTADSGYFYTYIRSVVHPAMRPVVDILEGLRQNLLNRYTEVEKDPASIDFTCADGLHERFMDRFFDIEALTHLKEVSLVPLAAPPSLIPPVIPTVAPPEVPPAEREPHPDKKSQAIKDTKKGSRSNRQRKPTAVTLAHRYNLRPRPKRS